MEPWEQNLQIQRDIRQAQTAASAAALLQGQSRQRAAQAAQARNQETLLQELIFEQQIAGFSETEKRSAREDRELGLDFLELRFLFPSERQRKRQERKREIQAELDAVEASNKQLEADTVQYRQKHAARIKRLNIVFIVLAIPLGIFCLTYKGSNFLGLDVGGLFWTGCALAALGITRWFIGGCITGDWGDWE